MTRPRNRLARPAAPPGTALTLGWVRLARAGILGGASLILATAGHVLGGGTLPGAGLLALIGVCLALVAVALTARRLRFGALLAVLTVEQVLLHLLFHASTVAACAPVATPPTMPGHSMALETMCGTGSAAPVGWSMVLGHTLAVAATAWLLARGEQWLWRVVDRVHGYATARPTQRRRTQPPLVPLAVIPILSTQWAPAGARGPPVA